MDKAVVCQQVAFPVVRQNWKETKRTFGSPSIAIRMRTGAQVTFTKHKPIRIVLSNNYSFKRRSGVWVCVWNLQKQIQSVILIILLCCLWVRILFCHLYSWYTDNYVTEIDLFFSFSESLFSARTLMREKFEKSSVILIMLTDGINLW